MNEWCLAHPWMTFFIALSAVNIPYNVFLAVRASARQRK
jgi:hypothetical protein